MPTPEQFTLARMLCDCMEALTGDSFTAIRAGSNPHDIIDANLPLYGAHCALHFAEPDAGNQAHADEMNAAWAICDENKWDRVAIQKAEEEARDKKSFFVTVQITETYRVWVDAEDEDEAEKEAERQLAELDNPTQSEFFENCSGFTATDVEGGEA